MVAAEAAKAVRDEDFVWAKLKKFQKRVDEAISTIEKAAGVGAIGVAYSGGKDSTVLLDLVRRVIPDAPAAFFHSGSEMDATLEMVEHVGAEVIHPRLTMMDMARYAGWWGYRDPVDASVGFDALDVLIKEPSETFVVKRRLRVIAHGLRGDESRGRFLHTTSRGPLYRGKDGTWYCMPLARWTLQDVWAYVASRGLRYHRAYDVLTSTGINRKSQRVAGALGERGSGWGRHTMLRHVEPRTWSRLVAEFPHIGLH